MPFLDTQTPGNIARVKLKIPPSYATAKADKLRDERIKIHNSDVGQGHFVSLHVPSDLSIDTLPDHKFNSWWGCFVKIKCLNCDMHKKASDIKIFLSQKCEFSSASNPTQPDVELPSITNQFRNFCGLTTSKADSYHDRRRLIFINLHNDLQTVDSHFIILIPPHPVLHASLSSSSNPAFDIARTHFFSCTKCSCTFSPISLRAGLRLPCLHA